MIRVRSVASAFLLGIAVTSVARAQEQPQKPEAAKQEKSSMADPPKGLQWTVGDYTVKLGGYVKVDLIHDFNEIGSTDSFDPRTIPTTGDTSGTNTRIHARSTRINLDVKGPTDIGPMRVFVEGDFFSDQNGFRLRHAFGTIDGWLGGQTWSTFMDEDCMPETLDYESPIAFPLIRQGQIRYTGKLEGGSYWAIALEDPASTILNPPAGDVEETTPDLTARLRWAHGLGHCQLGLFAGTSTVDRTAGPTDTVAIYGANLSAKIAVFEKDQIYAQVTYGPGVARYRGGITATPDANGNLDAIEAFGFMGAFEHHWNDKWRSTATYAWANGNLPNTVAAQGATKELVYLAANVIWQFSNKTYVGAEYLYGSNKLENDSSGEASRLQISLRFDF